MILSEKAATFSGSGSQSHLTTITALCDRSGRLSTGNDMTTFSGNYPIEHRAGEIARLHVQSKAMAPDSVAMLERFGPMQGWTCLDIGCGPGGITDLLSARVGPAGRVIGLDMDANFLEHARRNAPSNVEFQLGDAYGSDLPTGTFDLVHMRFVASTAGNPGRLLEEAIRLARQGGLVALQEPDGSTLNCYPPHPAWERLQSAFMAAFKGVGADLELARKLYFLVQQAGLRDVQYRTALLGVRSIDPMIDYLPSMVESLRASILKLGLLSESDLAAALNECRQHLAKPGTAFTMYTLAQVWGRRG
jgi:ubiquinone/menaquinone biosynthesis C-methylase UbiE